MTTNLTGRLLIASPYLTDGNFLRSVVLIVRHDAEGAFGLAINRPTARRFRELVEMTTQGTPREDDQIFRGGPLEGPLLAVHDLAGIGEPCGTADSGESTPQETKCTVHNHPADPWGSMSIELGNPPAWITGDEDHLRILLHRRDARVRYIAHYSGWGPGQLEDELRVGGWLVGEAEADVVFGDANDIWETAVRRCGHEVLTELAPGIRVGNPDLN